MIKEPQVEDLELLTIEEAKVLFLEAISAWSSCYLGSRPRMFGVANNGALWAVKVDGIIVRSRLTDYWDGRRWIDVWILRDDMSGVAATDAVDGYDYV